MSEDEIIREIQEEEPHPQRARSEYEPDPSKACENWYLQSKSKTESEIINCNRLADYKVLEYSEKKYIQTDGDEVNPKIEWKPMVLIKYYCKEHFDIKYKYPPPPTPNITFVRIKR